LKATQRKEEVMSPKAQLDCVIVGYNDVDFGKFAARQKRMESTSGAYHEIKTNSVLVEGRRITYMDLLNRVVERVSGADPRLSAFDAPSLGAYYLASFVRSRGLTAEVVNFFNADQDVFAEYLRRKPLAVAITTTFYVDAWPLMDVVAFVRKHSPDTKIIVGGPYAFNLPLDHDPETLQFVLAEIGADVYVIDSQGEATLAALLYKLRDGGVDTLSDIPNLYYTTDGELFKQTPRMPENNKLDESAIDWSLFNPHEITPVAYLRTARSCPFACTFCNYPTLAGEHVVDNIANVEAQLMYLHSIGATDIVFIDDTFNVPLPRFKNLLRMMIQHQFNFRWISFFRCSNADEQALDLMKESGCIGVFLGIESGDQQILKYMNKAATLERYKWGVRQLHDRGIATFASLICGFPGDHEGSVKNSLAFIEEMKPTFFNVQLYYHDKRSPIERQAAEFGIQGAGYSWRHKSMDWRDAIGWTKYIYTHAQSSGCLPLYGFSLWAVPYLMSRGFTLDQLVSFSHIVRPLLMSSLEEQPGDLAGVERQLGDLLRNSRITARSRGSRDVLPSMSPRDSSPALPPWAEINFDRERTDDHDESL
jgi:p-methyltransferase